MYIFWSFFPNRYRREKESIQQKFNEQEMKAITLEEEVKGYIYIYQNTRVLIHIYAHTRLQPIGWLAITYV